LSTHITVLKDTIFNIIYVNMFYLKCKKTPNYSKFNNKITYYIAIYSWETEIGSMIILNGTYKNVKQ